MADVRICSALDTENAVEVVASRQLERLAEFSFKIISRKGISLKKCLQPFCQNNDERHLRGESKRQERFFGEVESYCKTWSCFFGKNCKV